MEKTELTEKQIEKLKGLLVSWEDGNITDYKYVNEAGKILGLGGWTYKGAKK